MTAAGQPGYEIANRYRGCFAVGIDFERVQGQRFQCALPGAILETVLHQVGCTQAARRPARFTEHDGRQLVALARRRRDHVVAAVAREPGLEPIGARIDLEQLVVLVDMALAHLHLFLAPHRHELREIAQHGASEYGQIAGCCDLDLGRQTVRIGEGGSRHTEALGRCIHVLDERVLRAIDAFGQHHSDVVGALDDQRLQCEPHLHLGVDGQPDLGRALRMRQLRHFQFGVELELAVFNGLERQIGRHHLGQRRGMPSIVDVLGVEHDTVSGVEQQGGTGRRRLDRRCQRRPGHQTGCKACPFRHHARAARSSNRLK